jgi:hypothetical protein
MAEFSPSALATRPITGAVAAAVWMVVFMMTWMYGFQVDNM